MLTLPLDGASSAGGSYVQVSVSIKGLRDAPLPSDGELRFSNRSVFASAVTALLIADDSGAGCGSVSKQRRISMKHRELALRAAVAVLGVSLVTPVFAVNRFQIDDVSLDLGDTGVEVPVRMDSDQTILGFSVFIEFDDNDIKVTDVMLGSDVTPLDPEFSDGEIDNTDGFVKHAVIFDFSGPNLSKELAGGDDMEILRLVIEVVRETGGSDTLNLRNDNSSEPRRLNVMTDTNGDSVSPTLVDGTVTIVDRRPNVSGIDPNEGEAGTLFTISGDNFDTEGVVVRVCDTEVEHTVAGNGDLVVTAPECGSGPAEVEVCNPFGCDADPEGFTYPLPPGAPVIESFIFNDGPPGTEFIIVGQEFDQPGLTVEVCGVAADFELIGNGQQIEVVAPACDQTGPVRVEVCTQFGCDLDNEGFTYPPEGTPFIRGDTNEDGGVDLSDGVATLNFLFLGGTAPECRRAANANGSGGVDLADAVYTFNFLFLGGPPIPAPTGTCGIDEDEIPCVSYDGC